MLLLPTLLHYYYYYYYYLLLLVWYYCYIVITYYLLLLIRPAFKSSIWKTGPSAWEIWTFKGHLEVGISNGSGIWDPHIDILQIEIMRTDRKQAGLQIETETLSKRPKPKRLRNKKLGPALTFCRSNYENWPQIPPSEGGMIRLETLIELKFLNSSFSSLSSHWN